ncbi:MAG TPA: hypothetical protein VIO56_01035 [Methylotenera sp.]|jgi:hypothetical protein
MKLQICTREEAENLAGWPNWAVIAMTPEVNLYPGWHAVHCVNPGNKIRHEHAFAIVNFVRCNVIRVNGFLIIGDRDIARTQGVAAWLAEKCHVPQFALTRSDAEFALDPEFNQRVLEALRMADK